MILYLTRHGETDYNAEGRYQGRLDIPLNAKGIAQAKALAESLAETPIDRIVSSPQLRARKTAEIVAARLALPLELSSALVEINMGVFENLTREEARARYPEHWQRISEKAEYLPPPEGESHEEVLQRALGEIKRLQSLYAEQSVLVVCHGFVARTLHCHLLNIPYAEMQAAAFDNCEVRKYRL